MKRFYKFISGFFSLINSRYSALCLAVYGLGTNAVVAATGNYVGSDYADQIDEGASQGLGDVFTRLRTNLDLAPMIIMSVAFISGLGMAMFGLMSLYRAYREDRGESKATGWWLLGIGTLLTSLTTVIAVVKGSSLGQTGG